MPSRRISFTMSSGASALGHRRVEVVFEPDASAVDDAALQPLVEGEVVKRRSRVARRRHALEEAQQLTQRVVVVAPSVVDEVQADLARLVVDAV
jgi:hypothetical protein